MKIKKRNKKKLKKVGAPREIEILNKKDLLTYIKKEKDQKVKQKLSALIFMSKYNMSAREVSQAMGVSYKAIYIWVSVWNTEGYNGLKDKPIPGRPPRLDEEGIERLKSYLKERPFWTTKEARCLIKERFGIELSEEQTRRVLRNKLMMTFSKPYPKKHKFF